MLADRVSDLPVVDGAGKLIGMFKLEGCMRRCCRKAALIGHGMADLAFVSETLAQLREKMREIDDRPVHEFVVKPRHVVHPDTTPLEIVLLLHQGENNVPVVGSRRRPADRHGVGARPADRAAAGREAMTHGDAAQPRR